MITIIKKIILIIISFSLFIYPLVNKSIVTFMGLGFNFYLLSLSSLSLFFRISANHEYKFYYRVLFLFLLLTILTSFYPTFQIVEVGLIRDIMTYISELAILCGISYLVIDISLVKFDENIEGLIKRDTFPPSNIFLRYLNFLFVIVILLGIFVTIFADEEYFIETTSIGWMIVLIWSYRSLGSVRDFEKYIEIEKIKELDLKQANLITLFYGALLILYGLYMGGFIGSILFGCIIFVISIFNAKIVSKFLNMPVLLAVALSFVVFEIERGFLEFVGEIMFLCIIFIIFVYRSWRVAVPPQIAQ